VDIVFSGVDARDGHTGSGPSRGGRRYTEKARLVIGADGALSTVRRIIQNSRPAPVFYAALQEQRRVKESPPYYSSIFDPELTDYYCWTIPKDGSILVGGAFPWPDRNYPPFRRFGELLSRLQKYGVDLGKPIEQGGVLRKGGFIVRPCKRGQIFPGDGSIGLIGEAAGWISPSSAEGFSYAFKSAEAAAASLAAGTDGFVERYRKECRNLFGSILRKNLKSGIIFSPPLRRGVMKSGAGSVQMHTLAG
jgi:flavin-dependent dehydrogenase